MGQLVVIHPSGKEEVVQAEKLDLDKVRELIGCKWLERTKVRYNFKVRDCWLDEEGWLKPNTANPKVRALAEEYWKRPCQEFAGIGVVWVPTPRKKA